jgi:acyl transferase domain-containing protein
MLDRLNRYAHGYVAIPVIAALDGRGVLEHMSQSGPIPREALLRRYNANAGHFAAAVRLLGSLGWLDESPDGLRLTAGAADRVKIPAGVTDLLAVPSHDGPFKPGSHDAETLAAFDRWIPAVASRWSGANELLAEMLDGLVAGPVLIALCGHGRAAKAADWSRLSLAGFSNETVATVDRLWRAAGWGGCNGNVLQSDQPGASLLERGLNLATTLSYRPMLTRMDALLFGDARAAMAAVDGEEGHVDRRLNVTGSGFQHHRFFADLVDLLRARFEGGHPAEEPEVVVDMGAGDGSLLAAIHNAVRAMPGRDERSLVMVAADLNAAALAEAGGTLSRLGVPHRLLEANIDRPAELLAKLTDVGLGGRRTLHVRSFLDHDRGWHPPVDANAAARRLKHRLQGVHVAPDGTAIDPADTMQSLVEHLGRWSATVGDGGLAIAEVHALPALTVRDHLDDCENLHFDAYHALSGQHLVEADTFLLAMAEAGLFPRAGALVRYPRSLPFTRITCAWYERRPYRVRLSQPSDLDALMKLDEAAWAPALRFGRATIASRLAHSPDSILVAETDNGVAAAVYVGRLPTAEAIRGRTLESCLATAYDVAAGSALQLLGAVVGPDAPLGLGGLLLDFVIDWASCKPGVTAIAGVTRFGNYVSRPDLTPAQYLALAGEEGLPLDPILRFHCQRGARIDGLVPGFRPADIDNGGNGVLVIYPRRGELHVPDAGSAGAAPDVAAVVCASVVAVLRPENVPSFTSGTPIRELGLDSLDLQELRRLLATRLNRSIDPGFFFRFPSVDAMTGALTADALNADVRGTAAAADKTGDGQPRMAAVAASVLTGPVKGWAPIAIIGHAGRFPGADSPEALWNNLLNAVDAIGPVPPGRWDPEALTAREPGTPGMMNSAQGGFIDGIDLFDAAFFRLSRREAARLDPQQRLLLETSWQAFERAGIDPTRLAGSLTGVFTGLFSHDYELLQVKDARSMSLSMTYSLGGSAAGAAGRLSYFYGLQGPAIAVDTACSSSLVTIHAACRSLQAGDIDLAVCGGVNAVLSPELCIAFSQAGILSADARCRTLDASATGYGRAEGCGIVLLKRLDDAIADGDRIEAVVLGGALGQDGASNGFAAPNGAAQEAVIRRALRTAGLEPGDVDMVEMHGTGTAVGDVIEADALARVFAGRARPLILGAVKSAIGHLEAAAGVAGVIKLIQSFAHGTIPPNQHYRTPASDFDPNAIPATVPTAPVPWPSSRPVAGISSFGYSGTLAHLILAAPESPEAAPGDARSHHVYALSAPTATALATLAAQHAEALKTLDAPLADAAHTVTTGRAHFRHRLAVAATSKAAVAEALRCFAGGDATRVEAGAPRAPEPVAFLFSGQGGHHLAMAAAQFETAPVFRAVIQRCEAPVRGVLGRSLTGAIYGDDPAALDALAQPAVYAVQAGLSALLRAWGIRPTVVLGHSLGEFAAAATAGVFSLEDGARLVAHRARLTAQAPGDGAMAAFEASEERLLRLLETTGDAVSIAAYNAPDQTVVTGPTAGILTLIAAAKAVGMRCHRVPVAHAFHSAMMEPILAEFAAAAAGVALTRPAIPYISSVTGGLAGDVVATPGYWADHLRHPVRFRFAVRGLAGMTPGLAIECGPLPMLTGMIRAEGLGLDVRPVLGVEGGEWAGLGAALARAYAGGAAIDWHAVDHGLRRPRTILPTYPFERQRHWFSDAAAAGQRAQTEVAADA